MKYFYELTFKKTLFLFLLVLLYQGEVSGSFPKDPPDYARILASVDDQFSDPYEQLEQLESFYRQISENRLDHGLRAASMYLDKAYLIGDSTYIAKGYHLRAIAYSKAGDYLNSLKDNLKSLEITEQKGDTIAMCNTYNNLGILFEKLEKAEQSLVYFKKSLEISRKIGDLPGVATTLNNMGNLYGNMKETEKAIETLLEAQGIWKSMNDSISIAFNLGNIGNVYLINGNYREAERYFNQAMELFQKNNDKQNLAYTFLNLGIANHKQGQYNTALTYFEEGMKMTRISHQAHLSSLLLKSISETYASLKMYEKAYNYELKHASLKDSLMNQEALDQINFYQALYETEAKEREISLLRKDQELKDLQLDQKNTSLQRSRLRATFLLLLLVITLMTAVIIISRARQKRTRIINAEKLNSQREQLKAIIKTQEEERIRFARDLHDGLGQMLTALKINLVQKVNISGAENDEIPAIANSLIKEMHQEIRNISFNIMPQLLVQKGLVPALHELARKINTLGKITVWVFDHEVTHRFEHSSEIAIYRILQELLNNIIKYSNASQVSIQLIQHNNVLNIHVEDDGVGFDTSALKKSDGSGWKNICSRLKLIEGTIEFDSQPKRKNSTVIIDIPLKKESDSKQGQLATQQHLIQE